MSDLTINPTNNNFTIRNSLVSIFEQLLFLTNTLEQNNKKLSNSKTEDVNTKLKTSLNELFLKLCKISDTQNYFWHNCSLDVYKKSYHSNKEYLIKTYGKRRFYQFLENELNSFLKIKKQNNPSEKLNITNNLFQDAFIILDYTKFLDDYSKFIIEDNNFQKIDFLKSEIKKDNYYVNSYKTYFKIKKSVNRKYSGNSTVQFQKIDTGEVHIENLNVINLGDKAFPVAALNNLIDNFSALVSQNQNYQEYPEQNLNKKGLPKLNLQTRFELIKRLGFFELIKNIKSPTEQGKTKILGSAMDINADNARHLYKNTYKHSFSNKDEDKLNDFLDKEGIDL